MMRRHESFSAARAWCATLAAVLSLAMVSCATGKDTAGTSDADPGKRDAQLQKELEQLQEQVEANPSDADLRYQLANAHFDLGRIVDAATAYQETVRLDPNHARAWCNLGLCYRRLGNIDTARQAYERSLKIAPDDVTTLNNYVVLLSAQGDMQAMEMPLKRLSELKPDNAQAQSDYANLLFTMERFAEAADAYKKVITIDPGNTADYYNLGLCYYNTGDPNSALLTWLSALAYDTKNPSVREGIAVLYWERGDYDKAWEAVRECERLGIALKPEFLEHLRRDSGQTGPPAAAGSKNAP